MNADFAYLVGALGDASMLHRADRGEYCVEFEQKNKAWLEESIAPRVQRVFGKTVPVRKRKSGLYRLRIYSKKAFRRLVHAWNNFSSMETCDACAKASFVRGFFDAEGSAPRRPAGTCYRLAFYQKNVSRLKTISRVLSSLGIRAGRISNSREVGLLPVRSKLNVTLFMQVVGCEHPAKRAALLRLVFC